LIGFKSVVFGWWQYQMVDYDRYPMDGWMVGSLVGVLEMFRLGREGFLNGWFD